MYRSLFFVVLFLLTLNIDSVQAQVDPAIQKAKEEVKTILNNSYEQDKKTTRQLWEYAEIGFKESKSAALHVQHLKEAGFNVTTGVGEMPTAFMATYGSGKPIIGILAEYDALPGLAQEGSNPEKAIIPNKIAGHGCGHDIFGTASVAAGIAIKKLIASGKIKGTVRVYGSPAEEGGGGKVYLVRSGVMDDVDVAIHWHPGNKNEVTMKSALAYKSAKFRFYGVSAHAAGSPELGRSALDAVEAMDNMVNMMREHIPQETRIHYVITNGGKAPNVVPDFAEVFYYVRHPKRDKVVEIFNRVTKAAEGAAIGTGTTMKFEVIDGTHDLLLNKTLADVMQVNLESIGGIPYTEEEKLFAKSLQKSFLGNIPPIEDAQKVFPMKVELTAGGGSTDVGDVSYTIPTVGLSTATWVPGTPAHSWQAVSCGTTDIAAKGMLNAAKVMAMTAIDYFTQPAIIVKAKEEFIKQKGDYKYQALLGDRAPALNYRDN
ncbi:MAG: amidohydrolase [Bacteroidetes bacterium]|nr:amidohydrolase [Bacteroidota bacterium]